MKLKVFLLVALLCFSSAAHAADVTMSGGVTVSGMQILMSRRAALTVPVTLNLVGVHGLLLGARNTTSILAPLGGKDREPSIMNATEITAGWAWPSFTATLGAGMSIYSMSACNTQLCARVSGVAPTADLVLTYYTDWLAHSLGVQFSGSGGWFGHLGKGGSSVLNGVPIWTATLGPVVRFGQFFGGQR